MPQPDANLERQSPLLTVSSIKKYYRQRGGLLSPRPQLIKAVDGVSFNIYPGETLGLVGESGSGKSTLGRLIVRLEEPTEGRILFRDEDLASLPAERLRQVRKDIQIIFQDPYSSLNPRKRIGDMIAEPMLVHRLADKRQAEEKVRELLHTVGIPPEYRNRYPHEFSGGQRQRIGIARALSVNPKLIVCDEPVSALDVSIQSQILNLLKDLQQQFGLTLLFIAHGLGAVKYISDRIAVMYKGKLVELAKTKEIFRRPRHPYTQALLNAYPIPDPTLRGKPRIKLKDEAEQASPIRQGCPFQRICPAAKDLCFQQAPELKGEGDDDHLAACHFPNV